jgi:hypothetical protein
VTASVVKTTYTVPVFPAPPEDCGQETMIEVSLGDPGHDREHRGETWHGPFLQLRSVGFGHPKTSMCLNCGSDECCDGFRLPVAALKQFLEQNPGVLE